MATEQEKAIALLGCVPDKFGNPQSSGLHMSSRDVRHTGY